MPQLHSVFGEEESGEMLLKVSGANCGSCLQASQTKESRESKEDAKKNS